MVKLSCGSMRLQSIRSVSRWRNCVRRLRAAIVYHQRSIHFRRATACPLGLRGLHGFVAVHTSPLPISCSVRTRSRYVTAYHRKRPCPFERQMHAAATHIATPEVVCLVLARACIISLLVNGRMEPCSGPFMPGCIRGLHRAWVKVLSRPSLLIGPASFTCTQLPGKRGRRALACLRHPARP